MAFKTMNTANAEENEPHKVLLVSHHGFGKTYQCRNFEARYGKGFLISGESGLKSVADVSIDYLPFKSWDGPVSESDGVYSFKHIVGLIRSPEFREAGYKWIGIDSLTELSERLMDHVQKKLGDEANGFAIWQEYQVQMIGALKWIRDLDMHVFVTCLAKESTDDNDATHYWPNVKGNAIAQQVPALFDHVLCGIRKTDHGANGEITVSRRFITDETLGWHGKVRDPRQRLKPIEDVDDITELLEKMKLSDADYNRIYNTEKEGN